MTRLVNVDRARLKQLPILGYVCATDQEIEFSIYIREVGPLAEIYSKRLRITDTSGRVLIDVDVDYRTRWRQGIPELRFYVDKTYLTTSHLIILDSTGPGSTEYRLSLGVLHSVFGGYAVEPYLVSTKLQDENDLRFREFLKEKY